ncbi:hypothetical protein [Prevotella sp. OH937_COT-195]|uniref:hypothetical protein n=1 Tax=Prevotella sp. OH937_COT-195 TaxID=2491051 RepID=UPI000F649762|nr:hypothetical protein [Prevotella sp. OH937_COT-195]RRC99517.1 hypothetical protein EII32_07885 [Prevotella sp. OH937_COT-195]
MDIENKMILGIGIYVLLFFVIYTLALQLVKFVVRKIGKSDISKPEYVTTDENDKKLNALKERIEEIEKKLENLQHNPEQSEVSEQSQKSVQSGNSEFTGDSEPSLPLTFFLPPPSPDGVFHDAFAEPKIGSTVYKMTTIDGNNGIFVFYDNRDALATAMISISQIVKTVCRVDNNKNAPRNIINVKEGRVVREGNSWRVTEKATVRFE